MRILILTQFFDPEPASIPGLPLATWLVQKGHEVQVVTGFPNYPGGRFYPDVSVRIWRREEIGGVRVNRVILYPSHDRSALKRIMNYSSFALSASVLGTVLTRKPDVVYVYHPPATVGIPALLWKKLWGVPFVYHVQDLWPESVAQSGMAGAGRLNSFLERAIGWWCRRIYSSASSIVTLSPGMRRILIERGVPSEKVFFVPNWIDESIFVPVPRDESVAKGLGMSGHFNVVYSGNVGHFQNLSTALHAADILRDLPDFQLVIVGSGQATDELQELATRLGLENVLFVGRRPYKQMAGITAIADVLLVSLQDLPFFEATIPSKTQVALACGRPVLMAVKGDAADLIIEAGAGVVCTPGDALGMAEAVRALHSMSSQELSAMGERGRAYYEAKLSFNSGASHLESLLLQAVIQRNERSRSRGERNVGG
jgi:glycosyltransferase involved in cell wall biosynthesis